MGSGLGCRKQSSPRSGDVEDGSGLSQALLGNGSLPRRSASESCFPGLLQGRNPSSAAEEPVTGRTAAPLATSKSRCRQVWTSHSTHLVFAFLAGTLVSYMVFAFSMGLSRGHLHLPTVLEPASKCERSLPGVALSLLALRNQTGGLQTVPDRLIIAARHSEDTSWLDTYVSDIPHVVYQIDDANKTAGAQHATLANKGNEAMAYLQFIINYYDRLPPSMVFLQGHRSAWHMLDVIPVLQRLRWGHLGYASLRYRNSPGDRLDWMCGSRTDDPIWSQFDCDWEGAHLRPGNMSLREAKDVNEVNKDLWIDSLEMAQVWPQAFQAEIGNLPLEMQAPCCSSFMVSRERVLSHSVDFYIHLRDWILRTEMSSYRAGRHMEYMWHMIFGEPAMLEAVPECELLFCNDGATPADVQPMPASTK